MAIRTGRSAVLSPEQIHPALWRGTQLARPNTTVVATGYATLNAQLPGQGWPLGSLIECHLEQNGIGELQLFKPALQQLDASRRIVLLNPPALPHIQCLSNWQLNYQRILWIHPSSLSNVLWTAQLLLKHNTCSALLCWAPSLRPAAIRQLHLGARNSTTLLVVLQSRQQAAVSSMAPLRLALAPHPQGLQLRILKRSGPVSLSPLVVPFHAAAPRAFNQSVMPSTAAVGA